MKHAPPIQMDLLTWHPRQPVIGFPNEVLWRDAELFPGTWVDDPYCRGLYCQKVPEHWLVKLLTKLDRDADRREAKARELNFDGPLSEHRPQTQAQIEMSLRRHRRRHGHYINWTSNRRSKLTRRVETLFWYRKLPDMNIQERAQLDDIVAHELATHQWD
ncbi:MAG: hypothetical protein AAB365_03790 [Patescibacteria group bacterium]